MVFVNYDIKGIYQKVIIVQFRKKTYFYFYYISLYSKIEVR